MPTQTQSLTTQFLSLFRNRFSTLSKQIKDSGRWIELSRYHNLTDEEILEAIGTESKVLRAVSADDVTDFLVITIQAVSYYSSQDGLNRLRHCLKSSGVERTKLYQSSDECALHLFIFLDQPAPSFEAAELLSKSLRRYGVVPGTAGLNVFPSQDGFCLPLQPGFAWLNDDGQVIVAREQITIEAALALFFADFQKNRISSEALLACLKTHVSAPTNVKSILDIDFAQAKSDTRQPSNQSHLSRQASQADSQESTQPENGSTAPKNTSGEHVMPTNVVQWKTREKQPLDKQDQAKADEQNPTPEAVIVNDEHENEIENAIESALEAVAELNFEPSVERTLQTVADYAMLDEESSVLISGSVPQKVETLAEREAELEAMIETASAAVAEEKLESTGDTAAQLIAELADDAVTTEHKVEVEAIVSAAELIAELKAEAEAEEIASEETAYSWMHRTASRLDSDDDSEGDVLPIEDRQTADLDEELEDFAPETIESPEVPGVQGSQPSDSSQHEGTIPAPNEYIKDYQQLRFFD